MQQIAVERGQKSLISLNFLNLLEYLLASTSRKVNYLSSLNYITNQSFSSTAASSSIPLLYYAIVVLWCNWQKEKGRKGKREKEKGYFSFLYFVHLSSHTYFLSLFQLKLEQSCVSFCYLNECRTIFFDFRLIYAYPEHFMLRVMHIVPSMYIIWPVH